MHPATLGLSPAPLTDWLRARPGDDALLAERGRLIGAHFHDVIAALPEGAAAVDELAERAASGTPAGIPPGPAPERLAALGHAVAEDLCVLTPGAGGAYLLNAAVLCFPNRWRLADKVGKPLLAVHAPVPDYAGTLAGTVDRFLAKLRPLRLFRRENWGLCSTDALFLPAPVPSVDPFGSTDFFHRREEQSFLKLPRTEAVVFSIRTTVTPWRALGEAERAAVLADVRGLNPAWLAYKSIRA